MAETGPHLALAVLCEKILTEQDGVLSIIRIVDRLTSVAAGTDPPEQMPPFLITDLKMIVALKSGRARGRYSIKLVLEDPSGGRIEIGEQDINLQAGTGGVNLLFDLNIAIQHEGPHWFDVLFGSRNQEDELMTRVPLEIQYQRQRVPGPRPAEDD